MFYDDFGGQTSVTFQVPLKSIQTYLLCDEKSWLSDWLARDKDMVM